MNKTLIALAISSPLIAHGQQVFNYTFDTPLVAPLNYGGGGTITAFNGETTFAGSLQVTLADGGDGTYAGDSVESLDLTTNLGTFHADGGLLHNTRGTGSTVTLLNDAVDSFNAKFLTPWYDPVWGAFDPCISLNIQGLTISYDYYVNRNFGAVAPLIATVSPVPEPQEWALMLGGLFAISTWRRRFRRLVAKICMALIKDPREAAYWLATKEPK